MLQETAKILFARDVFRAFFGVETIKGFVFHFEPFQTDDADVFLVFLPNLTLTEFHRVAEKCTVALVI